MKEAFTDFNFRVKTLEVINAANEIIEDYSNQGYSLTLRQLYYQFVSRALIENSERSYKNLGSIINDGRMAGMIDWDAIEDRGRNLKKNSHWDSPSEIADTCVEAYYKDHWANQDFRVEVWVEKEALAGVAETACNPLDVPFFCCKGYTSQSEMYAAAQRITSYINEGKRAVVIHLGDHDPSGIDMSRDIHERLTTFSRGEAIGFKRIALNMDQVDAFNPPPNPAKQTDSRFAEYRRRFGGKSWELDALEPKVLVRLIQDTIKDYRDPALWEEINDQQAEGKRLLRKMVSGLKREEGK